MLEAIFDATQELVSVVDANFVYRAVNHAYTEHYGLPKEEIIGKHMLDLMDEKPFLGAKAMLERAFAGESLSYEQWFTFKNGKKRYMLVSYVPYQKEGEIIGVITFIRDYTDQELRRIEQEIQQKQLLQQAKMTELGQVSAFISHQWRSTLQVMASHMLKLRREIDEHAPRHSMMQSMDRCEELVDHLSETIQTFTGFYRYDKEKRHFCVREAICMALNILQKRLSDLQVRTELCVSEKLELHGIPNEWMQVILTLVINTLEACESRKIPQPLLRFEARVEGEEMIVTLMDNAGGITPEIQKRLFEVYTTDKAHGSGLGLYFARLILRESFQGDLKLESSNGETRAHLCVPQKFLVGGI